MHFNRRYADSTNGVLQGDRRVCVSAGIEHKAMRTGSSLYEGNQFTLGVCLREVALKSEVRTLGGALCPDLVERQRPINGAFAGAEQIEIGPVQYVDGFT